MLWTLFVLVCQGPPLFCYVREWKSCSFACADSSIKVEDYSLAMLVISQRKEIVVSRVLAGTFGTLATGDVVGI
jgi:hypothetical protein